MFSLLLLKGENNMKKEGSPPFYVSLRCFLIYRQNEKILLCINLGRTLLFSCQNNKQYTIRGVMADVAYEGGKVYLQKVKGETKATMDSAIVSHGKFSFKGSVDSTMLGMVALDETVSTKGEKRVLLLLEPGIFQVRFDSVVTVSGTKPNEAYDAFRAEQHLLVQNIEQVVRKYNAARDAGTLTDSLDQVIGEEYDAIDTELVDLNYQYVKENIGNELGKYQFKKIARKFEPEEQREMLDLTDGAFKSQEEIQKIIERLENLESVAVGNQFVDFTLKDPVGNAVSLSDYVGKGKYVQVVFWASWCGPCRREMPHLVVAYEQYRTKGLEMVGVSLDKEQEAWVQGVKNMNMTWPQMSDLKYWQSRAVELYAINGIPHTVLLDKEGVIIANSLRNRELMNKLAELMP